MNVFRVPLNLIVVMVLLKIGSMAETSVYSLVALVLISGLIAQVMLLQLTVESPENEKKMNKDEEVPLEDVESNESLVTVDQSNSSSSH